MTGQHMRICREKLRCFVCRPSEASLVGYRNGPVQMWRILHIRIRLMAYKLQCLAEHSIESNSRRSRITLYMSNRDLSANTDVLYRNTRGLVVRMIRIVRRLFPLTRRVHLLSSYSVLPYLWLIRPFV
jgi:hypothetical protein